MNHFLIFFSIFNFFGIAYFFSRLTKTSMGFVIPFLPCVIVLALYSCAFIGLLEGAVWCLRGFGGIGLLWALHELLKHRKSSWSLSTVYVAWMAFFLWLLTSTPNYSAFIVIDDYLHWGGISRTILENNRFVIADDKVFMSAYPPALALFHYYFLYGGEWSVVGSLLAQSIFCVSIISVVFGESKKEGFPPIVIILFAVSIYSLIWIFRAGFHTLWADLPLGLLAGGAVLSYLANRHDTSGFKSQVFLILLVTILIVKQVGLLFFFFSLATILLIAYSDYLRGDKFDVKGITFALALGALVYFSWRVYIKSNGLSSGEFKLDVPAVDLFAALTLTSELDRHTQTVNNFMEYLFFSVHTTTYWFLLCVFGGAVVCKLNDFKMRAFIIYFGYGALLFSSYLGFLLVLYLFSFSEWEGIRLASIDRYVGTFILAVIILEIGLVFRKIATPATSQLLDQGLSNTNANKFESGLLKRTSKSQVWIFLFLLLISIPNAGRSLRDAFLSLNYMQPLGNPFYRLSEISNELKTTASEHSRIYLAWWGGTTDLPVALKVMTTAREVNNSCVWVVEKGRHPGKDYPWACDLTRKEFEEMILSYDYLVVGDNQSRFFNDYLVPLGARTFKRDTIYKIHREGGRLRLEEVN